MKIKLIPVIEIGYNNQGITSPKKYPYWENQDVWFEYRNKTLQKAGFKDEFKPYLKGSPFFEPKEITDENLKKIVFDHTESLRNGEYERYQACCLFGGYVLRIDKKDQYFPQCCGTLGDIKYWEKMSKGIDSYYEGHPAPMPKFKFTKIIFDFSVGENEERFEPIPSSTKLEINRKALVLAVEAAKSELKELTERVIKINREMNWGIDRIEDLLIWGI
ncbi:MAG: hypothetical protein AB8B69_17225 [Chitinophagales bacterium]